MEKSLKLLPLFTWYENNIALIPITGLHNYCMQADLVEKTEDFSFGFDSLKWALVTLNSIGYNTRPIFQNIIFEATSLNYDLHKLQFHISSMYTLKPYIKEMKQHKTISLSELQQITIGPYQWVINNTEHNLTSKIMKQTQANGILFHNPNTHAAGVVFRVANKINKEVALKAELFNAFSNAEEGWNAIGTDQNLIINHGAPNGTASNIQIDQMIEIIDNFFN